LVVIKNQEDVGRAPPPADTRVKLLPNSMSVTNERARRSIPQMGCQLQSGFRGRGRPRHTSLGE